MMGGSYYIDRKTITNIKIDGISVMQISIIVSKKVYFYAAQKAQILHLAILK